MVFQILQNIIVALLSCAATVHYVHLLQMDRYQLPAYLQRLSRSRDRILWENALTSVIVGGLSLYLPVLLSMFVKNADRRDSLSRWIALALFAIPTVVIAVRDYTKPSKKPFVITHRIRRFLIVFVVLSIAATSLIRAVGVPPYAVFVAMPYLVYASALIINPYEEKLNAGYFKAAKAKIRKRKDLIVIGITGSFGKTNVKFLLRDMLSRKYKVLATPASFNTAMGISRVINDDLTDAHEVFIAEMGATHVGDIKHLVELVKPKYGILTSIGARHLDTFGSIDNIVNTKFELIRGLPKERSFAVFGSGDDYIDRLYAKCDREKYRVSLEPDEDSFITAEQITYGVKGTSFIMNCKDGGRIACRTPLLGRFNVRNILMAAAMARKLGVDLNDIALSVRSVKPIEHRLQLIHGDTVTIDDTLNTDVDCAFEALHVISQMPGKRIVVTPGLSDPGKKDPNANFSLGTLLAECADAVVLVGDENSDRSVRGVRRGLTKSGYSVGNIHIAPVMEDVAEILDRISGPGDTILFESNVPDED